MRFAAGTRSRRTEGCRESVPRTVAARFDTVESIDSGSHPSATARAGGDMEALPQLKAAAGRARHAAVRCLHPRRMVLGPR
eukprot:7264591-Prymnesium_polylepis.1